LSNSRYTNLLPGFLEDAGAGLGDSLTVIPAQQFSIYALIQNQKKLISTTPKDINNNEIENTSLK
jgi:hypothetical protein